jgi:hypothetical protein
MELRIQLLSILASASLLLVVLEFVRRKRFLERYALMWLFSALVLLALSVWQGALEGLAAAVGINYPPNALFLVAFGFVLILLLHFSLAVSKLSDQTKVLAQRVALLEERQRDGLAAPSERNNGEPSYPDETRAAELEGSAGR